eukprot:m.77859 g.77859  ORF g.77859 m.77859 type:complete len:70 (-) comp8145_c3_seq1:13-222(-)
MDFVAGYAGFSSSQRDSPESSLLSFVPYRWASTPKHSLLFADPSRLTLPNWLQPCRWNVYNTLQPLWLL